MYNAIITTKNHRYSFQSDNLAEVLRAMAQRSRLGRGSDPMAQMVLCCDSVVIVNETEKAEFER